MHIAHLTSAHSRDDIRIFLKECRSLVQMGHRVSLVVADGKGHEVRSGVEILDAGSSSGRLSRILGAPSRVLRLATRIDADVYQLHDPELLRISMLLKRQGKKVIFDAHEDVPKQIMGKHYIPTILRSSIADLFARYERFVCQRLDGIIAATPTIRDKFLRINSNVVDINNYPILGELEPTAHHLGNANFEVCYVGSIAGIRGIREIIKAIELTRTNIVLNLVGEFSEHSTEAEVRGYKGWQNVKFWGKQGREGVREILTRSSAGLVTLHPAENYIEALPIKMFEYMSAGVPVIASNFPLWRKIVEDNRCGICVDPLSPTQIADAIDRIAANPIGAREMGDTGRQAVHQLYNWAQEMQKLGTFYASLTER